MPHTLFENLMGVETPIMLDEAKTNSSFGHYSRILVHIDISQRLFDEIMVDHEGYASHIEMVHDKIPYFYARCKTIGYSLNMFNKLKNN